MKYLMMIALSLPFSARAGWDSVAVILRPAKALVQINEPGTGGRLRSFIRALSDGQGLRLATGDDSLKLECGASAEASSCVIRFLPGPSVVLDTKAVRGSFTATELGIGEGRDLAGLNLSFLNSNGDQFTIRTSGQRLELLGTKR